MTQLLAVKSFRSQLAAELVKAGAGTAEQVTAALEAAEEKAIIAHTFIPKDDEPERCSWPGCGMTRNTLAHLNLLGGEPEGAKAYVTLAGSLEETLEGYYRVAADYAQAENLGAGGFYALHPEGTYPDDSRAVYRLEGWDDPYDGGAYVEFRFAADDAGALTVEGFVEVTIEATATPKARRKAAARATSAGGRAAKTAPSAVPAAQDDAPPVGPSPSTIALEADLLDLDADAVLI